MICNGDNAGAIIAKVKGGNIVRVENCIVDVNITATGNNIGGIWGGSEVPPVTVLNCKNYGTIIGGENVGGINSQRGTAEKCQNYGIVKGTNNVGGISGCDTKVINCQNYGVIEALTSYAGGIIGRTGVALVKDNTNYARVTANSYAGGIAGNCHGGYQGSIINNNNNKGEVEALTTGAGGIAGCVWNLGQIVNCYNEGKIKGNARVGGIVGNIQFTTNTGVNSDKIINCFTIGEEIEGKSDVRGIVGVKSNYGTHRIEKCYWPEELNLECAKNIASNGILEITESCAYPRAYMRSQEFIDLLNRNVEEYNAVEENTEKLSLWKLDPETGNPTFDR